MAAENERYCFSLGIAVTRWRPRVNILSVSVHKAHPIWTMLANHRKWKQFNIFSWWPQWGLLCGGQWWLVTPISVDFASLGIFIGFNYWLLSSHTSRKVCPPHCLCVCAEVGQQFCRFCKQWLWGCPGPYCTMAPLSDYYIHLQPPARPDQWCQLKEVTGKITEDATPPINREHGMCLSVLNKQSWRRLRL